MKGGINLMLQRDFYLPQRNIYFVEVGNRRGMILKAHYAENKQQDPNCHILLARKVEELK